MIIFPIRGSTGRFAMCCPRGVSASYASENMTAQEQTNKQTNKQTAMWTVRVSPHKWIAASSSLLQCFVAVWPKHSIENMVSCTNPDIECSNLLQNIDSILDWREERSELESFQKSRLKDTRCQYTLVGLAKPTDRRTQRVFRFWYNKLLNNTTLPTTKQTNHEHCEQCGSVRTIPVLIQQAS